MYRSNARGKGTRLGAAKADGLGEPFARIRDSHLDLHVEDPYLW